MKKWIVLLTALMLLTTMAVPVFAADTEVTIAASNEVVSAGDEFELTVSVDGDTPFVSFGYVIDQTSFEFVSLEPENGVGYKNQYDETKGVCMVLFDKPTAHKGELFVLKLKVKQDIAPQKVDVSGRVNMNNGSDPVAFTVKSAEITITCRHKYEYTKVDDNTHAGKCSICGDEKTESHDWIEENVKPATCTEPGSETLKCQLCDATKETKIDPKGHAYDNDCDPDCNNGCGTTRDTSHKIPDTWNGSDDKTHWIACSACGEKVDEVAHIPDRPAATEKEPQKCVECGYVMQVPVGHVHDFDTIWQQDAENHWHVCKEPGCYTHGSSAKHDYDNECDVTCNTCGHVRNAAPHIFGTEWKGNASGHWYVCIVCSAQSEMVDHVPGDPATLDTPQICKECGYKIKWELSHEHTLSDKWLNDDTNHWKACIECFEATELIPHNWDEGTVITAPTDTMQGTMLYRCTDCGFERTAAIPTVDSLPTDPTEQTNPMGNDPTVPDDNLGPMETRPTDGSPADDSGFLWTILIVVAGLLLVTGIVLFVIEFIRSRKHNMHGKYSK